MKGFNENKENTFGRTFGGLSGFGNLNYIFRKNDVRNPYKNN